MRWTGRDSTLFAQVPRSRWKRRTMVAAAIIGALLVGAPLERARNLPLGPPEHQQRTLHPVRARRDLPLRFLYVR